MAKALTVASPTTPASILAASKSKFIGCNFPVPKIDRLNDVVLKVTLIIPINYCQGLF